MQHPRHAAVALNKERCVCVCVCVCVCACVRLCVYVVLDCWSTAICFWPVPIKIWFSATIGSLNVQTQILRFMYLRAERQSGQENKTKTQRLCFHAIHQIPSHYSKPRLLQGFHTSFIKYCGFGWLCPDGPSPCWPSMRRVPRPSPESDSRISGNSAVPGRWTDEMESL